MLNIAANAITTSAMKSASIKNKNNRVNLQLFQAYKPYHFFTLLKIKMPGFKWLKSLHSNPIKNRPLKGDPFLIGSLFCGARYLDGKLFSRPKEEMIRKPKGVYMSDSLIHMIYMSQETTQQTYVLTWQTEAQVSSLIVTLIDLRARATHTIGES